MPIKVSWDGRKYRVETWGDCGVFGAEMAQEYFHQNKELIKKQMEYTGTKEFVCNEWHEHQSEADEFSNIHAIEKFYLKRRTKTWR